MKKKRKQLKELEEHRDKLQAVSYTHLDVYKRQNIFSALYQVPSGAFPVKTSRNVWGGTTVYANKPIASISGRGYARSQTRNMYADMKLNQDLSALVKGLSAVSYTHLDVYKRQAGTFENTESD